MIKDNDFESKLEREAEDAVALNEDEEGIFSNEDEVPPKFAVSEDGSIEESSDDNILSEDIDFSEEDDLPRKFGVSDEDDFTDVSDEVELERDLYDTEDSLKEDEDTSFGEDN